MFVTIDDCYPGKNTNCIINTELTVELSKMQANILNGGDKISDF